MGEMIELQVSPAVARYLTTEYGPGPYSVQNRKHRDIRAALLYGDVWADAWAPFIEMPMSTWVITLYITSKSMIQARRNSEVLKRGNFFMAEFWNAMLSYVQGYVDYSRLSGGTLNHKEALASFLARYEIDEEILPFDSAYRQLYRLIEARRECRDTFAAADVS